MVRNYLWYACRCVNIRHLSGQSRELAIWFTVHSLLKHYVFACGAVLFKRSQQVKCDLAEHI